MHHRPRYSVILLHPTSLPGRYGIGDLGQEAYDFVDFLDRAGQSLWQVLPLGPTGFGDSPYQPYSAFAGQPLFISPDRLYERGLIRKRDLLFKEKAYALTRYREPNFNRYSVDYDQVREYKESILRSAYVGFLSDRHGLGQEFDAFCQSQAYWLDDYALFMALKAQHRGAPWTSWDKSCRNMDGQARKEALRSLGDRADYFRFEQFLFFRQWKALKKYANGKGISIIGDIPIFVSPDGADVWANKELFRLDRDYLPREVAGVPPDYFSETGQLWGNPLYQWNVHRKTGYSWWIARIRKQLELADILRIDHFRGFEAYWAVKRGSETAVGGRWIKGPGASFFRALKKEFGDHLPIIAEDLGVITPAVEKLRDRFGFPGMKILQFAFESGEESDYLPYLYDENCVCYTGTHDNDTALGWYLSTSEENRSRARRYMMCSGDDISWNFIRTAVSSTARYVVFPMQDVLGYGGDCRMNTPGTPSGNWRWRCTREALNPQTADGLRSLCRIYGRDKDRLLHILEESK